MIKGLIFDFDGLILDTENPAFQSWREIYEEHGGLLSFSSWSAAIGTSNGFDPYKHLQEQLGYKVNRELLRKRHRDRSNVLINDQSILPGVEDYISNAKRLNLRLGVASSSSEEWVLGHLGRLGLSRAFDSVKCSDHVKHTKPNPEVYQVLLDSLGLRPGEALAFEDSPNGILAAKRAGIYCVAVPNALTKRLYLDNADLKLPSLDSLGLADLLLEVSNNS
jgi:HAD superfamily hydrolase (TIGR01509 family)